MKLIRLTDLIDLWVYTSVVITIVFMMRVYAQYPSIIAAIVFWVLFRLIHNGAQ